MATGIEGTTDGSDCVEDVRAFYKKQIAELERQLSDLRAALEGKWISVGERLPEDHEKVLTYSIYKWGCHVGWVTTNMANKRVWEKFDSGLPYVTHWQPLPPAPKEA